MPGGVPCPGPVEEPGVLRDPECRVPGPGGLGRRSAPGPRGVREGAERDPGPLSPERDIRSGRVSPGRARTPGESSGSQRSEGMSAGIREALAILCAPGQVVEVRAITDEGMASGYFDDMDFLAAAAEPLDASGTQGIYITLNEVNPALLSRRANRIKMRLGKKDATTSDADILRRRWFPIDIDPVRPSGVSLTDEEHQAALVRAAEIAAFLGREQGWSAPVMADSGNGAHLLYRIDLPNDEESWDLVKRCLELLDTIFSDAGCSVDCANHNAARIWKLYGTVSRKGDHTPERPHRRAQVLDVPGPVDVVSPALLQNLAGSLPAALPPGRPRKKSLDIGAWLRDHGISVRAEKPYQGGTLFVLDECPFSGAHRDGAFTIQFDNGAVYAGCHHASCGGGTQLWKELRQKYERSIHSPPASGPAPSSTPAQPVASSHTRDEAVQILRTGDPVGHLLQTFALDHVGDETVAACLIMSLASQSVINTNGLHVSVTGESGKGKSHAFTTMLRQVPERLRLKGAMSKKALFYLDDMQPGSVIVLDDTTLSEEVQEILKSATTSFREPIEYRTVTKERKVRVCTIPERGVWWVAKVEGSGDDQVLNRMLTCWIDDSPAQDERVLAKDETVPVTTQEERREVLVCQSLWEELRSRRVFVIVPFARRIRFSNAANRRNPEMLLDLIKAHALLRCLQREEATTEDGSPCIVATREDFADAVRLYDHLNGTAGGQETKLTKVEVSVLDVIARAGWPEFTVQQVQQVTGRSSSSIRKVLHGYASKGYTYSRLLEKCPAISYTDRTVVSENQDGLSVRRRTTEYQFSPDLYRQWARGGSCWLEDERYGDEYDGDHDAGDHHHDDEAEKRNRAERVRKNSAKIYGPGSENGGKNEDRPYSVHNRERKIPDTEQQERENISAEVPVCDSTFSATGISNPVNAPGIAEPSPHDGDRAGGTSPPDSAPSTLPPGKRPGKPLKVQNFKKLDIIKKDLCVSYGRKTYLSYIEKLTDRRRKLPATDEPWYLCKECYQEMVRRERSSAPPLPGLIDVDRLERVTVDIGRCTVCGLEKAVWRDKERGVAVCEGCWGRENRL